MNARTTLSAKGQVVIPKDVRDRLNLRPGQQFEISEAAGALVLRPASKRVGLTMDELRAKLDAILHYDGPAITIEQMNEAITAAAIESARQSDCAGN